MAGGRDGCSGCGFPRFPFSAFVLFLCTTTRQEWWGQEHVFLTSSALLEGAAASMASGDGLFFLGPKGKSAEPSMWSLLGSVGKARLLVSLCEWGPRYRCPCVCGVVDWSLNASKMIASLKRKLLFQDKWKLLISMAIQQPCMFWQRLFYITNCWGGVGCGCGHSEQG